MNQYDIVLESIDEMDSVVTESTIDVLLSICESADKMSDMLNNSTTGFYQEATEPEKKDSIFKTILTLPIKLIQAIIKLFTGKDTEKSNKKIKEVSDKLKNEDESKIKALLSCIGNHKKSIAIGTFVLSAAAIAVFRKSIMNSIKNIKESFIHMTKMSAKKINIVFELDDEGHVRTNINMSNLSKFYVETGKIIVNFYDTKNVPSAEMSNKILKKWITNAKIVSYGEEETREILLEWCRKYDKFYASNMATWLHLANISDSNFKSNPAKNEKDQVAFNKLLEVSLEITKQVNKIHKEIKNLVETIKKTLDEAKDSATGGTDKEETHEEIHEAPASEDKLKDDTDSKGSDDETGKSGEDKKSNQNSEKNLTGTGENDKSNTETNIEKYEEMAKTDYLKAVSEWAKANKYYNGNSKPKYQCNTTISGEEGLKLLHGIGRYKNLEYKDGQVFNKAQGKSVPVYVDKNFGTDTENKDAKLQLEKSIDITAGKMVYDPSIDKWHFITAGTGIFNPFTGKYDKDYDKLKDASAEKTISAIEKSKDIKKPEPSKEKKEEPTTPTSEPPKTGEPKKETKKEFETYKDDERPKLGDRIKGYVLLTLLPKEKQENYGCLGTKDDYKYPIYKILNKKTGLRNTEVVIDKDIIPNIGELCQIPEPVFVWDANDYMYRCCTYDTKGDYGSNKKLVVEKGKEYKQINPNIDDDLETFHQDYFVEKDIDPVVLSWYSK